MHVITKSCFLLLWIHTLTFVKSQGNPADCTLQNFKNSELYDDNFDITTLETSYPGGRQVRVGCNVGYSGFFKLICVEGKWQARGTKCEPRSCGHPGDAQFADFQLTTGDDFVFGSKVEYTCHKGFQMVSRTNYRRCMAEGWDGVVPVCEAQQCPSIHVPSNVKVMGDAEEATYGNVVRFSCKTSNLILQGPREIFCNENGEWSSPVDSIICEAVKCRKPEVENGFVRGNDDVYIEHAFLSYTCNPGYKRVQEIDSRCTNSGGRAEWIPTPACEAIKCELTLPPLTGTTYEPAYRNRFSPGEKVRVTCGDRYWISDSRGLSAETTCKEDGQWTIRPVCQEVTCSRPRDTYLSYWGDSRSRQQRKLGDTVWYRCNPGYRNTGDETQARCTRDGWEPNPLCQEIKCTMRNYDNADIVGIIQSEYRINDRVQYKCRRGYEGSFTLTCRENGWDGSDQCTATTRCPIKSSEHRFEVWQSDNKLYYTCKDGYKPLTKGWWGEATCEDDVWSGLEDCIEEQECGEPPVIPNERGRPQRRLSQKSISITCKEGYSAEIERLTCHEGQWDLAGRLLDEICRPNADNCSPPRKVENAIVTTPYQQEYPSGSTVTYECRAKYTVEGEATIKCKDGEWEELNIKCIFYCDELKDEWQTMDFTVDKEIYKNGEIIKYQCKTKERSNGTAICQDGKWTKTIECEEKCTVPEIPASLRITTDSPGSQILKGQYLTFTCEESTDIIKGNATVECLANGQWSNPLPTCEVARGCGRSPRLSDGQITGRQKSQYSHNEKVEYVCRSGYGMDGGPFKTCINGEWTGEMRCRPAQGCGNPPPLSDGDTKTSTVDQYRHNDKVEYICQAYYVMEGGPYKTCIDGEWTGEIRCLQPCTVNREDMNRHNIRFKYKSDDKLYSEHNDIIGFACTRGRPNGTLGMRQRCEHGVIQLPTCQ